MRSRLLHRSRTLVNASHQIRGHSEPDARQTHLPVADCSGVAPMHLRFRDLGFAQRLLRELDLELIGQQRQALVQEPELVRPERQLPGGSPIRRSCKFLSSCRA